MKCIPNSVLTLNIRFAELDTCYVTVRLNRSALSLGESGNSSYFFIPRYFNDSWIPVESFRQHSAHTWSAGENFRQSASQTVRGRVKVPTISIWDFTLFTTPRICPTKMRLSLTYTRDYILIANFIGMALIPFVILTILNLKLFRAIKVSTIWFWAVHSLGGEGLLFYEIRQTSRL